MDRAQCSKAIDGNTPLPREKKNKNTARTQVCHLVAKRNRKTVGKT